MKWSTTLSFALAAGGVLALVALLTHDRGRDAARFIDSVEQGFAAGKIDRERFLRELDLAQMQAEREHQPELVARVQLMRGRALLEMGSFARARTDLAAVSGEGPARREIELLRIELERRADDPAAGLQLARAWLEAHADDARAWGLAGELHRMLAGRARGIALQACEKQLVSNAYARAAPLVAGLCARPAVDPRRVALSRDLRALFGSMRDADAEQVLVTCDQSAAESAAAREAYGRSLELEFDGARLAALATLFDEAGLGDEALDLLGAAWARPDFGKEEDASAALLHALVARSRWSYANLVSTNWLAHHPGSTEFLGDACRACYEALDGPHSDPLRLFKLGTALNDLRSNELGSLPSFYIGEAFFRLGSRPMLEQAHLHFSHFALASGPEPLPHARARAFRRLAETCAKLGQEQEERQSLQSAVDLEPGGPGETWLRLAEMQLASLRGGFREPDLRWARGMAALPARTAELMPRWNEIGEQELRALGIDLRSLKTEIQSGGSLRPTTGAAPFELYALARAHIEGGKLADAGSLVQELSDAVPGFVPALDLRLDLALARGRPREILDAFLARLERAGYDARSRAVRASLPENLLEPSDLRRIVQADPETSGRLAVARSFAARGAAAPALRFLAQIPVGGLGAPERVLAARLELASAAPGPAFERLAALGEELTTTPGALETWIDAGLRAGRIEELRRDLPARIAGLAPDRARFEALADRLLQSGEVPLARGLLARLDNAGRAFRGGGVLWRLCACALALGDNDSIARLAERTAAFDTRGDGELVALLALPSDAPPEELRVAVKAVRRAGWTGSPLARAALALLADEPDVQAAMLGAARKQAPLDPLPGLLESAPDKRALCRLLLELERPALAGAALAEIEQTGAALDPNTRVWLRACLHRAAGERESEQRVLEQLSEKDPRFAPAWDRRLELSTRAQDEGEPDLDLAIARAEALGADSAGPGESDWLRSRKLERAGALEDALAAARAAAAAAPGSGPILHHLGRLALRMGRLDVALLAYGRALPLLPAASGTESTGEYLDLLGRARAAQPALLTAEEERGDLEQLAASRPDDPRVLLAQARNDLETSATDPAFGADRAAARLEQFRVQHPQGSFESLAAGSTEGWTRFLLELDPALARRFLEGELERDPGNLDAWSLRPRCSAAEGDTDTALAEVMFLQRLAPGSDGMAEYLRARAEVDWTPEGVALVADRLRRLDSAAGTSASEFEIEMRAYLNQGPRGVPQALQVGVLLTPARIASLPPARAAEVHWMQAVAWIARGDAADLPAARQRIALLSGLWRDAAHAPLVLALRGLARP